MWAKPRHYRKRDDKNMETRMNFFLLSVWVKNKKLECNFTKQSPTSLHERDASKSTHHLDVTFTQKHYFIFVRPTGVHLCKVTECANRSMCPLKCNENSMQTL